MTDRIEQHLGVYRAAMNVRTHRQEMLASNIANADTPHFKARDLDFKEALANVRGGAGATVGPVELTRTQRGHLPGEGAHPFGNALKYRAEFQGAVDGNTVNMDVERAAFTENALQLEALITLTNKRLQGLETAIKGQ